MCFEVENKVRGRGGTRVKYQQVGDIMGRQMGR